MADAITEAVQTLQAHHRHLDTGEGQDTHPGRLAEARDTLAHALGHMDLSDTQYRKLNLWHRFACEQTP